MAKAGNPQGERVERKAQDKGVAVDPVCGMDVDTADASVERTLEQGKTYYFCSPECRREFERTPESYLT